MLENQTQESADRAALGIPPVRSMPRPRWKISSPALRPAHATEAISLVRLLTDRVPPGVDEAARVKAGFLAAIARGTASCPAISPSDAVALLGTMLGGYNVAALVELLDHPDLGPLAAEQLAGTLLVFDDFHDVAGLAEGGNPNARPVLRSWAAAAWFTRRPEPPAEIHLTAFRVDGEIDHRRPVAGAGRLVPGRHPPACAVPAAAIGPTSATRWPGSPRSRPPGRPVAFVGDVVGTGSSRKSAVNSLIWHIGTDIPFVPNKRQGGVVIGAKIAPIFFNTLQDAGALAIEADVSGIATGDHLVLRLDATRIERPDGAALAHFEFRSDRVIDQVRAGGRVPLDHRPAPDRQGPPGPGPGPEPAVRRPGDVTRPATSGDAARTRRLHPGPEDRGPGLRRRGRRAGHLLRADGLHGRQPGHHRPHEPQRTPRTWPVSASAPTSSFRPSATPPPTPSRSTSRPSEPSRPSCATAAGSCCGPGTASSTAG